MTLIKRSLEDESHRYPHVYKNLQLCEMTKEELSSRRMTTPNPSAKSTHEFVHLRKKTSTHVKSVGSLLFVCLFYKAVNFLMTGGIVLESAKGL